MPGNHHYSCFICGYDKNQTRFYSFPKDERRRMVWATAMKVEVNEIPYYSRICVKHFVEDDFHTPKLINVNMKIRLRQTAVPSRLLESINRRRWKLSENLKSRFKPNPPPLSENNSKTYSKSLPSKNVCVICGLNRGQNVSYHLFPKSDQEKNEWLLACNINPKNYRSNMRVCSIHFEPHVIRNNAQRHRLIGGAMPSLCLPNENVTLTTERDTRNEDMMSCENRPTTNENGESHDSIGVELEELSNRSNCSKSLETLINNDMEIVNLTVMDHFMADVTL